MYPLDAFGQSPLGAFRTSGYEARTSVPPPYAGPAIVTYAFDHGVDGRLYYLDEDRMVHDNDTAYTGSNSLIVTMTLSPGFSWAPDLSVTILGQTKATWIFYSIRPSVFTNATRIPTASTTARVTRVSNTVVTVDYTPAVKTAWVSWAVTGETSTYHLSTRETLYDDTAEAYISLTGATYVNGPAYGDRCLTMVRSDTSGAYSSAFASYIEGVYTYPTFTENDYELYRYYRAGSFTYTASDWAARTVSLAGTCSGGEALLLTSDGQMVARYTSIASEPLEDIAIALAAKWNAAAVDGGHQGARLTTALAVGASVVITPAAGLINAVIGYGAGISWGKSWDTTDSSARYYAWELGGSETITVRNTDGSTLTSFLGSKVYVADQGDRSRNSGSDANYREIVGDSKLVFAPDRSLLARSQILVKTHVGNAPDAISVHWGKRQFSV